MGWFDIPYDYELSAELSYKIKFPSADEEAWLYYGNSKGWNNVQD